MRLIFCALLAFLAFGAIAFLAFVVDVLSRWRERRQQAKRFAMDPVRRLRS